MPCYHQRHFMCIVVAYVSIFPFLYSNTKFFSSCLRRVAFLSPFLSLSFCAFICARLSRQGCRRCRTEKKKMRKACYLCICASFFNIFFSLHVRCAYFSLDISQKKKREQTKKFWEGEDDMVRLKIDVIFNFFHVFFFIFIFSTLV